MNNQFIYPQQFADLFIKQVPFLDVRAETEFLKGAFPGAVNLPLLIDNEREKVGICYKKKGQQAAIDLGHQLVCGPTKNARINAWIHFLETHPNAILYCFRGGMRSEIAQQWLQEKGVKIARIEGGYKALRNYLISVRESFLQKQQLIIVAGRTGTGKTRVIQAIPQNLDLEAYAHHRGSAFGQFPEPQPSQINFENRLSIDILKKQQTLGNKNIDFIVEDESRLIGRNALPDDLRRKMAQSPFVFIEEPIQSRIQVVIEEYVEQLSEMHLRKDPDRGWSTYSEYMLNSLQKITKRLGNELTQSLLNEMKAALQKQQRCAETNQHAAWIEPLLTQYYDKMYDYQLNKKQQPCLFKGNRTDTIQFLLNHFL